METISIGDRIKQIIYEKRLTGFELASKAHISEGGLSQIINGKIKNLKIDTAWRLAKALNVSPMYLITGVEDTLPSSSIDTSSSEYVFIHRFEVGIDESDEHKLKFTEYKCDRVFCFHQSYFTKYSISDPLSCKSFKVYGNGMEPIIKNGDYIVVDCSDNQRIIDGNIYAFCDSKGLHVKRLIVPLLGGLIIRSDNPDYEDEFLSSEAATHIQIVGHVIDRAGAIVEV